MQFDNFKWLFESSYEKTERGIRIYAPEKTNLFVNPSNDKVDFTIPFLYQEVEGDFVLRAKVCHDFQKVYDACVLLALDHERMWAKACFEFTDIGTHSVVTVMNNGNSDDANNEIIDGNQVWLQLARKGNVFAIHYSLNGKEFKMARIANLPMSQTIKVGFGAQSPVGPGGMRYFEDISFEKKTLEDIRGGNY